MKLGIGSAFEFDLSFVHRYVFLRVGRREFYFDRDAGLVTSIAG